MKMQLVLRLDEEQFLKEVLVNEWTEEEMDSMAFEYERSESHVNH